MVAMTDKELLLKDLCCRLPYGVKVQYENKVFDIDHISAMYEEIKLDIADTYTISISEIKPYLFPLSSMTKEQKKQYEEIIYRDIELSWERYYKVIKVRDFEELQDFYHANHLDYRGLIKKGLAIDATGLNIY